MKKTNSTMEKRTLMNPIEIRSDDDGVKKIYGYAAKFNQESNELGHWYRFVEVIDPTAFDGRLEDDVRALFNHDSNMVLGRTKSHTLKLSVDEFGLRYEITPPDTQVARDLIVSMERGDINQSSFGFTVEEDVWEYDETREIDVRTIKKVKRLYDVSPVTYPAYEQTESVARSLEEFSKNRTSEADLILRKRKLEIELELEE